MQTARVIDVVRVNSNRSDVDKKNSQRPVSIIQETPRGGGLDSFPTIYTMYTIYTIYTMYTIYIIYTIYRLYLQ